MVWVAVGVLIIVRVVAAAAAVVAVVIIAYYIFLTMLKNAYRNVSSCERSNSRFWCGDICSVLHEVHAFIAWPQSPNSCSLLRRERILVRF